MKQLYLDLWQTKRGSHFGLDLRGYFLKRKEGNVLFYYTNVLDELEAINNLGGIDYQYLSHHHEMQPILYSSLEKLKPTLCFHNNALRYHKNTKQRHILFGEKNQVHSQTIEVIDAPGHTNTNLCFRYQSPFGKSYLFTGDTIYLDKGKWNFLVLQNEGGSYQDLKSSLLLLKELSVDVIICSVAVGENKIVEVTQEEWHGIIDGLLRGLSL